MLTEPYLAPAAPRQFIDMDPEPFVFHGWRIVEYQKTSNYINVLMGWDAARGELYVDDAQKNNDITGSTVRERLRGKTVLNADALDFLLKHPKFIPEDWKKKDKRGNTRRIFFWGTIYCRPNDDLYVRYLCWDKDRWVWDFLWLGALWQDNYTAALWHHIE
jgi:hypothetical protein